MCTANNSVQSQFSSLCQPAPGLGNNADTDPPAMPAYEHTADESGQQGEVYVKFPAYTTVRVLCVAYSSLSLALMDIPVHGKEGKGREEGWKNHLKYTMCM